MELVFDPYKSYILAQLIVRIPTSLKGNQDEDSKNKFMGEI